MTLDPKAAHLDTTTAWVNSKITEFHHLIKGQVEEAVKKAAAEGYRQGRAAKNSDPLTPNIQFIPGTNLKKTASGLILPG